MGIENIKKFQKYIQFIELRTKLANWIWKLLKPREEDGKSRTADSFKHIRVFERSIYFIDRYLASKDLGETYYQLLGATSLFIGIKYENYGSVDTDQISNLCHGSYSEEEIIIMELDILESINYNTSIITSSEIAYFLIKYFSQNIKNSSSKLVANVNTYAQFAYNFIPYI